MGAGAMQGMCSKHDFKLSGNRGTGDFICDMGGSTMHSKSTMTLTGDTGYRTEIAHDVRSAVHGQKRNARRCSTARNVGACKPGQRPGDMVLPNGQTLNMRDAMAAKAPRTEARRRRPAAEADRQPG